MEEGFDMEEGREDPRHVTGTTVQYRAALSLVRKRAAVEGL